MKLRSSEKSLWQDTVLTYAHLGQQMEAAIRQADEFIEAYRERTRPTPKLLAGEEVLVSKVRNILPGVDAVQGAFITQQAISIVRGFGPRQDGFTIRAIRQLREQTRLSLRESKGIIDATFDFLQEAPTPGK